jgi:LCP family protein required for cell wall assembly
VATEDSEKPSDFRSRLADIPAIGSDPVAEQWATARPPVVRPPAPVARPAQHGSHTPVATPTTAPDETYAPTPGEEPQEEFELPLRRRRRWPLILFVLFAIGAIVVLVPLFMARRVFDSVERVPVAQVLSPASEGTNILLVGTDSRSGIDATTENAGAIIGEPVSGERTDTIMILRIEDEGTKVMSLPRDLWLPIDGGGSQRINTAFSKGPTAIINTVQSELAIPITHYVQVDLAGFIDLVDAVDGVDITIPYPAFDRGSGLDLPIAGTVTLDSTQALAYVRSRFYTEIRDGQQVVDGTSDLGRVQRQQDFMRALIAKVSTQRNPFVLNDMASSMADAVAMDDATSLTQALQIANTLRSQTPETVVLPTVPSRQGNAAVLLLGDGADEILADFQG